MFAAAQRGLSETHLRTNITHARARVARQWSTNALLRDHSKPEAGTCYVLKSPARDSLFPLRSYTVGILGDLFPEDFRGGLLYQEINFLRRVPYGSPSLASSHF